MDPRAQLMELLDEALQTPVAARPAFLGAACGDDTALRREIESLLALETAAGGFLGSPALAAPPPKDLAPGTRIGSYRIDVLLGRGGMGAVYRAVREDDFEKQVALKLVERELAIPLILRRFHRERQILARLEHPNIARLLDGGTTQDGRPYLVMEHVEGLPIDRYCEERRLTPRERLELCLQVASALAYAHQNLVVHRDLKPGNVLVTHGGVPKLLDFGIAKLLDPAEDPADATRTLERPMTPGYASPEQARGEPVTPASDLYSFGVLLRQLLAGDRNADRNADLDAILRKALSQEPSRRYLSMEHMAEDIRRYLSGHPVQAREGSVFYRAGKLAGRHRWMAAAVLVVLVLGAGFLVREQRRRQAEKQRTERTVAVLRGLLDLADPDQRDGAAVVRILDRARRELTDLKAEPELRAELLGTLGGIHRKLGHGEAARAALTESLAIWRRSHPEDRAGIAARLNNLGALDLDQGERGKAEARFREALALREGLAGLAPVSPEDLAVNLDNLATVLLYRGAFDEAEAFYRRGLAIRLHQLGPGDPRVSYSLRSLGALLYNRGDYAAAERLLREALHLRSRGYGEESTELAPVLDLLGSVRLARGDLREAEALFTRALDLRRLRLGKEHVDLARSERNLAELRLAAGKPAEARHLAEKALARLRQAKRRDDWHIADVESLLGAALAAEGHPERAEVLLAASYGALAEARGESAAVTRDARRRLEAFRSRARPR